MPLNKEAYIRYKIIDECLRNAKKPYPSMDDIIRVCEKKLGKPFSVSTIQKDIKSLKEDEELGYLAPIKFSKSKNGYFYADKEYSISNLPLQTDEIEALQEANEILQAFNGRQLSDAYNQAFVKLMNSLNAKTEKSKEGIPYVFSEQPPLQSGFQFFYPILNAIKNKKVIQFEHINYHKIDLTEPIVHPYQLIEFNHYWYLIGYSQERKKLRIYGLDRIMSEIKILKLPFNNSKIKEVKKYNTDMYGVFPIEGEKKQEIRFCCTDFFGSYIDTHPLHHSQKKLKSKSDLIYKFSINVIPTYELVRWIFANATDIRVMNPNLRKLVLEMKKNAFGK